MLCLELPSIEIFNEQTEQFETIGGLTVELEHSLYTVAKWEAKHKTSFMSADMDLPFLTDYAKEMCITKNVPDNAWLCLTRDQLADIISYMNDSHTATKINRKHTAGKSSRSVTAELIYYWMFSLKIPMECEHWHFNRLMTLIEVSSVESMPKKKMGKKEAIQQQKELNAMRRAKYGTKG